MHEKITDTHLQREAVVYVRQSSMHQVRHNLESKRRQYNLKDRASDLGFGRVRVIDEDLGRSGAGSAERRGFGKLLEMLCDGVVGAVFAMEASRLARNNRDWHHLVDLCALTETLVIDQDGVYDPRQLNDRLLLGLKGTMSEFELSLMRQRAQEALREKVRRGEVLTMVPIGYVRTEDNHMQMTPDLEVQQAIRGIFEKFTELGSARQVLLWYRQEQIPLPTWRGFDLPNEVVWRLPVQNRILSVIKNPAYAGAFVYGRRCTRTAVVEGRARRTSGHEMSPEDWEVVIRDHHDSYISWDDYVRNNRMLKENAAISAHWRGGAVKRGPALLSGLLRCGRCGRKLHVGYDGKKSRVARYFCRGGHINHGVNRCLSVGALRVDQTIAQQTLWALRPAGVAASICARQEALKQADARRQTAELALERASYEAERARRQYDAVDPGNRLVASELERRWNEALTKVTEVEARLAQLKEPAEVLDKQDAERLAALGEDLSSLWHHPQAPMELKKRILRTVINEVVIDVVDDPLPQLLLTIHWAGGVHTSLRVPKNRSGQHGRKTDWRVVDLIRELAPTCDDASVAAILNRLGYKTGWDNPWNKTRVKHLRNRHKIPAFSDGATRKWLTLNDASGKLGISRNSVRKLIRLGVLPARQVVQHAPWIIEPDNLRLPAVRAVADRLRSGKRIQWQTLGHVELPSMADSASEV